MTQYVSIIQAETLPTDFTDAVWTPWLNCKDEDKCLPLLAANKFIRERGGVLEGEKLSLFVCVRPEMKPVMNVTHVLVTPK